uniref:CSON006218 protein n=1 Tax=Culicoides sonorensis TaxID=179676 RepID=A0A336MY63_CULSO
MDKDNFKNKPKGGAQKKRDKDKKALLAEGAKLRKIDNIFAPKANTSNQNEIQVQNQDIPDVIDMETDDPINQIATSNPKTDDLCHTESYDYFAVPSQNSLDRFLSFHPKQESQELVLKKAFQRTNGTNRRWVTYCAEKNKLYCFVCLAFSKNFNSLFIQGYEDRRHIHQRLEEHEKSQIHTNSTEAYVQFIKNCNIEESLGNLTTVRRAQIQKNRDVLQRVIDVLKLIGKRGLSYRGSIHESARTLNDEALDHGNFLEVILLLSKYDAVLSEHINKCVEESSRQPGQGRGSLTTFLSKTTINKIVKIISNMIQETIVNEVNSAGMFSLQLDTTQDITSQDQCSIVLRYVTDKIHERVLCILKCEKSTGEYFSQLVTNELNRVGLNIGNCVGNSTDGAANMNGAYNGFSAFMLKENPNQLHIWCYAHILNLVLVDCTNLVIPSFTLFNLLNDVAVFIKDSYQRMNIWDDENESVGHKKLGTIGQTRWWSKDNALRKIFGEVENPDTGLFVTLMKVLLRIEMDLHFNPTCRVKAKAFKDNFLKFETIITAHIFLRIFSITSPLSKLLQSPNADMITASVMIKTATEQLMKIKNDFDNVLKVSKNFVIHIENKLRDHDFEVETELPKKRNTMNPLETFKTKVHDVIMDKVVDSMQQRFENNFKIIQDIAILSPIHFDKIQANVISNK